MSDRMLRIAPTTTGELAEVIADAAAHGRRFEIRGHGSKAAVGRVDRETPILYLRALTGVVDYDPAELVLTVRAGTPLAEIEALLARERQMLAFEPLAWPVVASAAQSLALRAASSAATHAAADAPASVSTHGPIHGPTVGGIIAAGSSGPRRLARGAARDHVLGFTAVSGRGETFVAGGKVVKNVTGYDLPKLVTGSWGRLAALVEITLKVLPRPPAARTCVVHGLAPRAAWSLMARALGSQAEVAAAAHLPGGIDGRGEPLTLLRLEGFGPSVTARAAMLERLSGAQMRLRTAETGEDETLWNAVRTLAPLAARAGPLWRMSMPARAMPDVVERLGAEPAAWLADWAGGLVWLRSDAAALEVRSAAQAAGGHAMLASDPYGRHACVPTFHPQPAALAALEARVRRGFDPAGVFATGRFGDGDAH